jgi:hypothetical protein
MEPCNQLCPCCNQPLGDRQIRRHRALLRRQLAHDIELADQEPNGANLEAPGNENPAPGNAHPPLDDGEPAPDAHLGGVGAEDAMDEDDDFGMP